MPSPRLPPTTDPQDELFDVLDADGNPTGASKPRWQVHRDGDWHGALHIWLGGVDQQGDLLVIFQRRSLTKDTDPGKLDVAVGGHIRSGETLAETVREAEEEIGLRVTLDHLVPIGRRFVEAHRLDSIDREVQTVFAVRSDQPLVTYTLHADEVDGIVAVRIDDAICLFAGDRSLIRGSECDQQGHVTEVEVTLGEFGMRYYEYPLAALHALRAVVAGHPPEPFEIRSGPSSDSPA